MTNFKKWVLSALLLGSAFMGTAAIADDAYQQASDAVARDNDEAARRQHEYYKNQPSMGNSNVNPNTGSAIGSSAPRVILPDSWGAVAIDAKTGSYGYANKYASKALAIKAAVSDCNSQKCRVVSTYKNICTAFSGGDLPNGNSWSAVRVAKTAGEAEESALSSCNQKARNCQILMSECSMP